MFFPSSILMFLSRIIQIQTLGRILRTFLATFERKAELSHLQSTHFTFLLTAAMVSTNRGPQRDNGGVNNEHVKGLRTRGENRDRYYLRRKQNPVCGVLKTQSFRFTNTTAIGQLQNYILYSSVLIL